MRLRRTGAGSGGRDGWGNAETGDVLVLKVYIGRGGG